MNLTQLLSSPQGRAILDQVAGQLGVSTDQAAEATKQLMPAIQTGMRTRIQKDPSALGQIFGGQSEEINGYLQNENITVGQDKLTNTGNSILGQIFGSKEVSREVASRASAKTGLDIGMLKSMLPVLASLAGSQVLSGSKSRSGSSGGLIGGLLSSLMGGKKQGGADTNFISAMLDQDGDGSIADDLMGMAGKFLNK